MALCKAKRTGVYHVDFVTPNGERIRKSTRTKEKAKAQEYHDRLKASLWDQEMLGSRDQYSWKDAAVRFLQETSDKASHQDDIWRLGYLDRFFGNKMLNEITSSLISKVSNIKRKESSPSTANRHLALINVIMRKAAREWDWLESAPTVKLFKEPKRRIRWLTKAEAQGLLQALPDHLEAMARFTLATGLRMSNVTHLEWSQIDMSRRVAWVHADTMKNRRALAVPLNDTAIDVLQGELGKHNHRVFTYKGRPIARANVTGWQNTIKRIGLKDFRWHDLRHTWASWHVQNGTPLHALQELGGWESVEMVRRYAHLGGEHLAEFASNVGSICDKKPPLQRLRVVGNGI
jgi:integrase